MAHERAKQIRNKLTAAVAVGGLLVPGAASAKPKGLYASVQEGSYAAAASVSNGVSCKGRNKGGVVTLRPGNVPSTIRFDVEYPAVSASKEYDCTKTDPMNSESDVALKSLTTTVFKVRSGRGVPIARVDVYGNGDDERNIDVHKRTRVNTGVDICDESKIAVIAQTHRDEGLSFDVLPDSPLGEIHSTLISTRSFDISDAEIFTPKC